MTNGKLLVVVVDDRPEVVKMIVGRLRLHLQVAVEFVVINPTTDSLELLNDPRVHAVLMDKDWGKGRENMGLEAIGVLLRRKKPIPPQRIVLMTGDKSGTFKVPDGVVLAIKASQDFLPLVISAIQRNDLGVAA